MRTYSALAQALRIVEQFREVYQTTDREKAVRALGTWWAQVQMEGPREFLGLSHMLTSWREEILNYFNYRVTNGFAEG